MTDFFETVAALRSSGEPFAIATVIAVRGSASAKPGSKAVIDQAGRNVWGWVGGGCAESFVARNAIEAMGEGRTRIVQADLDDEIFGLGMPCGGVMDVFIDPQTPPEPIVVSAPAAMRESLVHLAAGYALEFADDGASAAALSGATSLATSGEAMILALVDGIARKRGVSARSLRETKGYFRIADASANTGVGANIESPAAANAWPVVEFLIMGSSRITEELAKYGALAKWPVRVYGWNLDSANYPKGVVLQTAGAGYADLEVKPGSVVLVASHHKGDHEFIEAALHARAAYVGLIASEKRSRLVFEHLEQKGIAGLERIHAPAGLDLACKNPGEIAMSVVSEITTARLAANERVIDAIASEMSFGTN